MAQTTLPALLAVTIVLGTAVPEVVRGQAQTELAGGWALNRELSQLPREIGFGLAGAPTSGSGSANPAGSGGRGRRRSGGGGGGVPGGFTSHPESEDDAARVRTLTAEARQPSERLAITETPTAVTITDDRGQSRTFHPDGKEEVLQLDGVPVSVIAKWDRGRLVVLYSAEEGRQVRYTYARTSTPPQLVVDVQFVERGDGDAAKRIYEAATATNTLTETQAPAAAAPPAARDRLPPPAQAVNLQPGAEFKGLTKLGIVVEDVSPQGVACGLNQRTLETALSKRVSDAGFTILKNSDEDTYLYVNIITTTLPSGLCVSRYDAFIYTHTAATLSYGTTPVLAEVSLLHKGGLSGSAPSTHGADVQQGVQQYVDQFLAQIRAANK